MPVVSMEEENCIPYLTVVAIARPERSRNGHYQVLDRGLWPRPPAGAREQFSHRASLFSEKSVLARQHNCKHGQD